MRGRRYSNRFRRQHAALLARLGVQHVVQQQPSGVLPQAQKQGDTTRTHFDSVQELCMAPFKRDGNRALCETQTGGVSGRWIEGRHGFGWYGREQNGDNVSAATASKRVMKGWPEGADRAMSVMSELNVAMPVSVQRRLVRGEQGDELDIHSVYRGDIQHAWSSRRRKHIRNPLTVRVVVQCNLMSAITSEQLFWRGGAVLKLVDILCGAGYNVEIIGAIASYGVDGYSGDFLCTFPLKESKSPLDVSQLAGVICNAGFHRLYGFRAYFALASNRHGSEGSASSDTSGRILADANLGEDGVTTFITPYGIGSKEQAEQWVVSMVKQLDLTRED